MDMPLDTTTTARVAIALAASRPGRFIDLGLVDLPYARVAPPRCFGPRQRHVAWLPEHLMRKDAMAKPTDSHSRPTGACDPNQRGRDQNTAGTERKILKRGLAANCIYLARFQNRGIANQDKAPHNVLRRCSRRKSHHGRGTKIGDQVFRVAAQ